MENTITYQEKLEEYLVSVHNLMYTFEITKCCGYSSFITIYKDEPLSNLYSKVSYHFGDAEIAELYFINSNKEKITVPLCNKPIFKWVKDNVTCRPPLFTPLYSLPNPVVYRLFMDDGYHCQHGTHGFQSR